MPASKEARQPHHCLPSGRSSKQEQQNKENAAASPGCLVVFNLSFC